MVLRNHSGFVREDKLLVGTLVEGLRVVQVIDEPGRDEANAGYDKNDRLAEVVGDGARLLGNGGADRGEASRVRGELADEAIGGGGDPYSGAATLSRRPRWPRGKGQRSADAVMEAQIIVGDGEDQPIRFKDVGDDT